MTSFELVMFFLLSVGFVVLIGLCASLASRLAEAEAKHDELAGDYPSGAKRVAAIDKALSRLTAASGRRFDALEAHVTAEEKPSVGRHARTGEMDAVTEVIHIGKAAA